MIRGRLEPATNYQQSATDQQLWYPFDFGSLVDIYLFSDCWLTSKLLATMAVQIIGFKTRIILIITSSIFIFFFLRIDFYWVLP